MTLKYIEATKRENGKKITSLKSLRNYETKRDSKN